jgi:hypothetical protein
MDIVTKFFVSWLTSAIPLVLPWHNWKLTNLPNYEHLGPSDISHQTSWKNSDYGFWVWLPCSLVDRNQHFEGSCCLTFKVEVCKVGGPSNAREGEKKLSQILASRNSKQENEPFQSYNFFPQHRVEMELWEKTFCSRPQYCISLLEEKWNNGENCLFSFLCAGSENWEMVEEYHLRWTQPSIFLTVLNSALKMVFQSSSFCL